MMSPRSDHLLAAFEIFDQARRLLVAMTMPAAMSQAEISRSQNPSYRPAAT